MTNRERWIVYPLLAFALMMGMRSQVQNPLLVRAQKIECTDLQVKTINGKAPTNQGMGVVLPMVNQAMKLVSEAQAALQEVQA